MRILTVPSLFHFAYADCNAASVCAKWNNEGTVRIRSVGRSRRLCAQFNKERVVNKMKKCDEELFSLKGQRNSNEDDEKQRQNLFGLLRTQVVEQLDMTRELTDDELYASIDEVLMMPQYRKQFSVRVLTQLRQALYDSFRRLDVLSEALDDPEVTEIMVNGYDQIYVEKQGELVRFPKAFSSQEKL